MSTAEALSVVLIVLGTGVMAWSIHRFRGVLRSLEPALLDEAGQVRRMARVHLWLMGFFLASYLVVLACLLVGLQVAGRLMMAVVFLSGALFVLLGIVLLRSVLRAAAARVAQVQALNDSLRHEHSELSRAQEHLVRIIEERRTAEAERDRLQAQLYQSEKLKALGTLAGGIAHDFNNMLGGIMGFAELIKRKFAAGQPGLERYANTIIDTSRRAAELTAELLSFARKGGIETTTVDLHAVIEDVVALLERTIDRRITIARDLQACPATVNGDRGRLHNALLNLALNARDAMPGGGTLTFATRSVPTGAPQPGADLPSGRYVAAGVSDTGVGMSQETRKHLFEPFFTTKPLGSGTGLGLASVYGTAKAHQGTVLVDSQPGRGSTFTLYLPCVDEQPAPSAPPVDRPMQGSGRILVVDDEEVLRVMATEMLRELGYQVHTCADGIEALEWYRRNPREVDLVLLDVMMPRMSGYDCFKALRELNPALRVLVATGYADQEQTQRLLREGAAGILRKPFSPSALAAAVAGALSSV